MRSLASVLALMVAACSLAPEYKRPSAPIASSWPASTGVAVKGGVAAADLGWRDVFGDERLQALIGLALANNRDLRVATLNVELARATYRIQRSQQLPSVSASSSVTVTGNRDDTSAQYEVGVGVTAFELDLWGRVRNLKQQALEEYFATVEGRRGAQLSLVAEVASQYLLLRALDAQLEVAARTLAAVSDAVALTQRIYEAGGSSELDVRTAVAQLETARADILALRRQGAQVENALVLLVGQPLPATLPPPQPLEDEAVLAEIPAGLPSDLLARRPDVLAAEHLLKGTGADIGVARAAFFPSISLTGSGGLASPSLGDLFSGDAALWSFAPRVDLPIFNGGRNRANLAAAKVRDQIQVARYERTIQVAFREVADALAARATLDEQLAAQEARLAAERGRNELSNLRYTKGIDSYLVVLVSQRDLYAAEQQLIQVRLARLQNIAELYKALGGGWRERTERSGAR